MTRMCTIPDCSSKHFGKGFCQKHYLRARRTGDPHTVRQGHRYEARDIALRIAERVTSDGDCLIYQTRRVTRAGHVTIFRDGRYVGVHRAAWELANGPVPRGLYVLHRCDRPRCVNVAHLFLGTIADNNADRDQKGRHVALKGSANGFSKLNEETVAIIKRRLDSQETTRALAEAFSVSQATVWSIKAGRSWRHVAPAEAVTAQ